MNSGWCTSSSMHTTGGQTKAEMNQFSYRTKNL